MGKAPAFWTGAFYTAMIHYDIHPVNPQRRLLEQTVDILKHEGGICIYPTDTVYGMGACVSNPRALERIAAMLKKDNKRLFSFICADFSQISVYAKMENWQFKLMKRYLPGPYTFILHATHFVPKKINPKRKTVGIRMPDTPVCRELARMLDEPLANTSLNLPGQERGNPELIMASAANEVDIMLDTGPVDNPIGSTIIDCTGGEPVVVREGKGDWHGG